MRLKDFEQDAILSVVRRLDNNASVYLFGSRADDTKKGGDIDLYVETACTNADQVLDMKLRFLTALKSKIGDQKIDVIIKFGNYTLPIYQIAKETGIQLI